MNGVFLSKLALYLLRYMVMYVNYIYQKMPCKIRQPLVLTQFDNKI